MILLEIRGLKASVQGRQILNGVDLTVNCGEVHAVMGPNGSGKSTLANVIAGRDGYVVEEGYVSFDGNDLLSMTPQERALSGVFLAFQYPVEIPGVTNMEFLKTAMDAHARSRGQEELPAADFIRAARQSANELGMDTDFLKRGVNDGFSGGEKKRNEVLQMLLLNPRMAVLDETDSGLDIDAMTTVAAGVNAFRRDENALLLVTHYQRLLNHIRPDFVHVLIDGVIAMSGDDSLAIKVEENGYGWLEHA